MSEKKILPWLAGQLSLYVEGQLGNFVPVLGGMVPWGWKSPNPIPWWSTFWEKILRKGKWPPALGPCYYQWQGGVPSSWWWYILASCPLNGLHGAHLDGKLGWTQHSKSWNSIEIRLRVQKTWKPGAEPTCTVYLGRKVLHFSLIILRRFPCVIISIYHFGDWHFFVWVNFCSQIENIKLGWIQGLHIFPNQLLTCVAFVICLIDRW